jgi:gluconate 2-dehydrogenase gamma chain
MAVVPRQTKEPNMNRRSDDRSSLSTPADPARRRLLQAGAAGAAVSLPFGAAASPPRASPAQSYVFFNAAEAAFVVAAVNRIIPADEIGPGAIEAGVPYYIDRQLAGAWGVGARFYRSGPWQQGTASQGYQLPFTPAELFRNAIRTINGKTDFAALRASEQDAFLAGLQKGSEDLDGIPSPVFFDALLGVTIEGYFADPVYGGNRDMVAWKMIGFPGAYAEFYELVDKGNQVFRGAPTSLAQDASGRVHVHVIRKRK